MATIGYEKLTQFFKSVGRERLDGIDSTFFEGMDDDEKRKAYQFLLDKFNEGSEEAVSGLRALVGEKANGIFIERINKLRGRKEINLQRLFLSSALWENTGDVEYQNDMIQILENERASVRISALSVLEKTPNTKELLQRLEVVCLNESHEIAHISAVQQLLKRYGLSLYENDKVENYKQVSRLLRSEDLSEKKKGLSLLKKIGAP